MLSLLSAVLSRWENNFDTILFSFSDLLALEITKFKIYLKNLMMNKYVSLY